MNAFGRKNRWGMIRSRSERGFYLIGLLLAVTIIMILAGRDFMSSTGSTAGSGAGAVGAADTAASVLIDPLASGANQVQMGNNRIDRTKDLACDTNRMQAETDLTMMATSNGGQLPHPDVVRDKVGHIGCPIGGRLQFDRYGNVYCTEHKPAGSGTEVAWF